MYDAYSSISLALLFFVNIYIYALSLSIFMQFFSPHFHILNIVLFPLRSIAYFAPDIVCIDVYKYNEKAECALF